MTTTTVKSAKEIKIVFMGTPEFAVPSLRALVEQGYNVVGVVTTPDRAAGRGQKIFECAVKEEAARLGLPILQPEKLRDEEFQKALKSWEAELQIVIAFRMLPESVWAMPQMGTFNLHASLLPQYRGAAPINHAIMNGDKESGVTTFLLNDKIDQGAIIGQKRVAIGEKESVGELYEKLMNIGPELVIETVERLAQGEAKPIEQQHIDETTLRPAPKIFKQDCLIDWSWNGERIVNFVRALSPYPAAWCNLTEKSSVEERTEDTTAKIFEVSFENSNTTDSAAELAIGEIESDAKSYIAIGCADGKILIESIQLAGKKRLTTKELLLGFKTITNYTAR